MLDYTIIGKRLKDIRVENNLTQTELANEVGVSTGYICQIENGDKCFSLNRLEEVAKIFEKPISYFVGEAGGDLRSNILGEIIDLLNCISDDDLDKVKRILDIIAE